MLEDFVSKLSEDFKVKVLETTRKEVYNILGDKYLTDYEKDGIEMYFVQPLYYSKLYYFMSVYYKYNETDIESIVTNDNISDDDKRYFLDLMLTKLNLTSTDDVNKDAQLILNKLFYSKDIIKSGVEELKKDDNVFNILFNNKTSLYFNEEIRDYVYKKPSTVYSADELNTHIYVPDILKNITSTEEINKYLNEKQQTYYENGVLVLLKASNLKKHSFTLGGSNSSDEKTIEGYIWDITIVEGENQDYKVIENNKNYFGFDKKYLTFSTAPKNKIKVEYTEIVVDDDVVNQLNANLVGFNTKMSLPFKIDAEVTILHDKNKDILTPLTEKYIDYDLFFRKIGREIMSVLLKNSDIVKKLSTKAYLSPMLYKIIDASYVGIPFMSSKITSSINKDNCLIKIKKITCEDTENVYTF